MFKWLTKRPGRVFGRFRLHEHGAASSEYATVLAVVVLAVVVSVMVLGQNLRGTVGTVDNNVAQVSGQGGGDEGAGGDQGGGSGNGRGRGQGRGGGRGHGGGHGGGQGHGGGHAP